MEVMVPIWFKVMALEPPLVLILDDGLVIECSCRGPVVPQEDVRVQLLVPEAVRPGGNR